VNSAAKASCVAAGSLLPTARTTTLSAAPTLADAPPVVHVVLLPEIVHAWLEPAPVMRTVIVQL
jgi:hypothetical protein